MAFEKIKDDEREQLGNIEKLKFLMATISIK